MPAGRARAAVVQMTNQTLTGHGPAFAGAPRPQVAGKAAYGFVYRAVPYSISVLAGAAVALRRHSAGFGP